ncbi:MAG: preprotein translocase subunit YajC [Ilumatobacteraceae bacterium]|nr:preprotein translocase subunit YajC [Ilumatobacteraceae bacterium]
MFSQISTSLLASGSGGGGAAVLQIGILLLIPFAMYFFMIRPQRRRAREQQDLQGSLQVGDDVVTTSGIYGKITGEDGDTRFWLEIDDDVQIRVARAAVQGKVTDDADVDDDEAEEVDDDDFADDGDV